VRRAFGHAERADKAHPRPGGVVVVRSTPFEPSVAGCVDVASGARKVLRPVYECGTRRGERWGVGAGECAGARTAVRGWGSVEMGERGVLRGAVGVVGVGERGAGVREREGWWREWGEWV